MKHEVINIHTKEVIYQGKTIKACRIWAKANNKRSPDYWVRKTSSVKPQNNYDSCIDMSDISNL